MPCLLYTSSKLSSGKLTLDGKDITHESIRQRSKDGMGHIPEDRHKHGLVLADALVGDIPVSYTHLDVYKRQVEELSGRVFTIMLIEAWYLGVSANTVSYTHLMASAVTGMI